MSAVWTLCRTIFDGKTIGWHISASPHGSSKPICECGPGGTEEHGVLITAAPDLLAALRSVQKLISEAAMTGFNHKDGDWAERLFASQQVTSAAIKRATNTAIAKAEGKST